MSERDKVLIKIDDEPDTEAIAAELMAALFPPSRDVATPPSR